MAARELASEHGRRAKQQPGAAAVLAAGWAGDREEVAADSEPREEGFAGRLRRGGDRARGDRALRRRGRVADGPQQLVLRARYVRKSRSRAVMS